MDENRLSEMERRVQEAIRTAMEKENREHPKCNKAWTDAIVRALTALGRELGYKVRGARTDDRRDYFERGWLWDLTWAEVRDQTLISLPLIAESEWDTKWDAILWDFQKLIVSRAALRVMIFETRTAQIESHFSRLIEVTQDHTGSQTGDRYLFACWDYDAKAPRFKLYRVRA